MKKYTITEQQFKNLIENIINKENNFEFDSDWKEDFLKIIKDIKGLSYGIFKSFSSTDELDYNLKTKENYLEDMVMLKRLVNDGIEKLK